MEFTKTEKCQRKLVKDGYIFVFKKMLANDLSLVGMYSSKNMGNVMQV